MVKLLTVEDMKNALSDRKITVVAERTGIHPNTLYKLVRGDTKPSMETAEILTEYLTRKVGS